MSSFGGGLFFRFSVWYAPHSIAAVYFSFSAVAFIWFYSLLVVFWPYLVSALKFLYFLWMHVCFTHTYLYKRCITTLSTPTVGWNSVGLCSKRSRFAGQDDSVFSSVVEAHRRRGEECWGDPAYLKRSVISGGLCWYINIYSGGAELHYPLHGRREALLCFVALEELVGIPNFGSTPAHSVQAPNIHL